MSPREKTFRQDGASWGIETPPPAQKSMLGNCPPSLHWPFSSESRSSGNIPQGCLENSILKKGPHNLIM